MIKVNPHPTYTIQVGEAVGEFDKDYALVVSKKINGKTTYEVDFAEGHRPESAERAQIIIDTAIRHLNIHGAFSPKQEEK